MSDKLGGIFGDFWISQTWLEIRTLSTETKLLAIYLMTNDQCMGVKMGEFYYLQVHHIQRETGIYTILRVCQCLHELCEIGFCQWRVELRSGNESDEICVNEIK